MNLTRDRIRSIGWAVVLVICLALTFALTFRVNAVKSQAMLAERQVIALKKEKLFLETEFETRSNQHQLKALNDVEFGYKAPSAEQYIEGERQLVALGKPRSPDAPAPIRVASASGTAEGVSFPAMVSAIAGEAHAAEFTDKQRRTGEAARLDNRLAQIELRKAGGE